MCVLGPTLKICNQKTKIFLRFVSEARMLAIYTSLLFSNFSFPPQIMLSFAGQQDQTLPRTNDGLTDTNAIIVRNLPPSVDEELLEIFFESTKKQGGGPVKTVKLFSDEKFAIVEFCEPCSVETVLKKKPVRYGKTKLDIQPYKPLLRGAEKIYRVDLEGLMDGFSDDLLKKHFESKETFWIAESSRLWSCACCCDDSWFQSC